VINRPFIFTILIIFTVTSGLVLSACNSQELKMAPMEHTNVNVQAAPARTQQAYQFAIANPETLQQIPCYCGCVNFGHTSNYDCYVAEVSTAGVTTIDEHALACTVCVDITQDVMTRLRQGETIESIQGFIDRSYSKYGPPTIPETNLESES